jgi:hypothetical protein
MSGVETATASRMPLSRPAAADVAAMQSDERDVVDAAAIFLSAT